MSESQNARAWSLPGVIDFFSGHRRTIADVYPSEWLFLKDALREGVTLLDVGCALGGFASIAAEHLRSFTYTGIDISSEMIERARACHPMHEFIEVSDADFSALGPRRFDLVLCLGILHLNERWREMIAQCWSYTRGGLILDLRETHLLTVEDKNRSYFKMDFHARDSRLAAATVPYNVVNSGEALQAVRTACSGLTRLERYGYLHAVRDSAVTPIEDVVMTTYLIERGE